MKRRPRGSEWQRAWFRRTVKRLGEALRLLAGMPKGGTRKQVVKK